jgi:hypothetical protein
MASIGALRQMMFVDLEASSTEVRDVCHLNEHILLLRIAHMTYPMADNQVMPRDIQWRLSAPHNGHRAVDYRLMGRIVLEVALTGDSNERKGRLLVAHSSDCLHPYSQSNASHEERRCSV